MNLGFELALNWQILIGLMNKLIEAKSRKIPIFKRAEMLGELVTLKKTSIAVSGTHGKTTSTTMIGEILTTANLDPTLVVGGLVKNLNTNSKIFGIYEINEKQITKNSENKINNNSTLEDLELEFNAWLNKIKSIN